MTNKKNRITIAILGFFVLAIPLLFLCYSINREFSFAKERIEEDLREKILNSANKIENKLDPLNYLKSEFKAIHEKVFPDCPEELLNGIPEKSFSKNLYTEKTLSKLISIIKDKFSPIIITLSTEDFEKLYAYYSPELEEEIIKFSNDYSFFIEKNISPIIQTFKYINITRLNSCFFQNKYLNIDTNNKLDSYSLIKKVIKEVLITCIKEYEKKRLIYSKSFFDMNKIVKEYKNLVKGKSPKHIIFSNLLKKNIVEKKRYYLETCYRYISRFSPYIDNDNLEPLYSDYYNKQKLYPILGYTFSKAGIHGFYSFLIPQSDINPEIVLKSALNEDDPDIKITLEKDIKDIKIYKTKNGIEYRLNYPTIFTNQINVFKRIKNRDYNYILNTQIKVSINYPQVFKRLRLLNVLSKITATLIIFIYILLSYKALLNSKPIQLKLTKKLIIILALILFLPIIGIGILSFVILHNIDELIDINVNQSLRNKIENFYLLEKEKDSRRLSFILAMKKIISNTDLDKVLGTNKLSIFNRKGVPYWFRAFTSNYYILNESNDLSEFDDEGGKITDKKDNFIILVRSILSKHINNLGIKKSDNSNKANTEQLALALLDSYISPKREEKTVGQESIPNRDIFSVQDFDSSVFYYAKDKKQKDYYLYNRVSKSNEDPYDFFISYNDKNPKWFDHRNKYSYGKLAIFFDQFHDGLQNKRFPQIYDDKDINNLISRAINTKYSEKEIIKGNNSSTISEWLFTNNSPFIIGGTVKSNHNTMLKLAISLIFPALFTYAIVLLVLFSGFISNFINTPIDIYKETIMYLENNRYGSTIEKFSNDEFNNITKAFNEMSVAIRQKEQIKRYVSDKLVQSVENNDVQEAGDGKQEKVTILSSDIRNFTGTSEKYEPSEIVEMLNSYFTKMQKAISDNGGIIDKYIGDAIQAVFYDEPDKENQVIRASKAALAMRKALIEFNEERKSKGLFTIENGIGIDTDFAITGTIGTKNGRKDFSVNGDVIARAADLEAKTKKTESKILISKISLDWIATQSTTARNDGNNTYDSDTLSLNKVYSNLVYKDFDNDSVELIDVRE